MMDEIDIEEHDLLENPKILKIFPDLTILKKEIEDPYYIEQNVKSSSTLCETENKVPVNYRKVNIKFEINSDDESCSDNLETSNIINEQNGPERTEKDVKSTNTLCETESNVPVNYRKVNIKFEINSDDESCSDNLETSNIINGTNFKNLPKCNKIILGSKPLQKSNNGKLDSKVVILLKDIGKYLDQSDSYCNICQILFPERQLLDCHKSHNHTPHKNNKSTKLAYNHNALVNNLANNNECSDKNVSSRKCFHCHQIFPSQMILIEHLYNVLESRNAARFQIALKSQERGGTSLNHVVITKPNELKTIGANISSIQLYQCDICSYYFKQQKFYNIHMKRKHIVYKVNAMKKVKFNPICKYCCTLFNDFERYNAHLHKKHRDMILKNINFGNNNERNDMDAEDGDSYNNTDNDGRKILNKSESENKSSTEISSNTIAKVIPNFIFKSVLFKCLKCDINFLSPEIATDHIAHKEMLINWRCSLCMNCFKRNDEEFHRKQHLHTNHFTVFSLEPSDLNRLLFKCGLCAVHFKREGFANHLKICQNGNVESSYCCICDILVDSNIISQHKLAHNDKIWKSKDYIIIDDSINVSMNKDNLIKKKGKAIKRKSNKLENTMVSKRQKLPNGECSPTNDHSSDFVDTSNEIPEDRNKDFRRFRKKSLSLKKIKTKEVSWNIEKNDDYSKMNCKIKIQPRLILNLAYCPHCECFVSKFFKLNVHLERHCNHVLKKVCNLCGLTITNKAVTSHKAFHKLNPKLKLCDFTFYDIKSNEIILPPIPKLPQCNNCETHFMNKNEVKFHLCSKKEYLICDICDMKFTRAALKLHIPFHVYCLTQNKFTNDKTDITQHENVTKIMDEPNQEILEFPVNNDADVGNVSAKCCVFICDSCDIAVSTYDQLIEHCHSHFDSSYRTIQLNECTQCNLTFEHSAFEDHKHFHANGRTRNSLKIFSYNTFQFGCNNDNWLQHVFKSLPENEIKEIITKSIYSFENRIKIDVTQRGTSEFTLYRCAACRIFIDSEFIYKHWKNCKGLYKNYPCDTCGIPFLSTLCRQRHDEVHQKYPFLNLKSFTIAIFNRTKDKLLNSAISENKNYYVLYQCRTCSAVVYWKAMKQHRCDVSDLKKCNICNLLISNKDYEKHVSRHTSLPTFVDANMKIILFGGDAVVGENSERTENVFSFKGLVYDYTFYKCVKCDVCIRHLRPSSKHHCLIDAGKWQCCKCNLIFDEGNKKSHSTLHTLDTGFKKDIIRVIPFDPLETYERLEREFKNKHKSKSVTEAKERANDPSYVECNSVIELSDTIFKCQCGLHHLTEDSAKKHLSTKKCFKNYTKQICSKCNLSFTSEVLYQHLLKHHGDKNIKYHISVADAFTTS